MFGGLKNLLFLLLLVLPVIISITNDGPVGALAQEDEVEEDEPIYDENDDDDDDDDEDEAEVDGEGSDMESTGGEAEGEEGEAEDDQTTKGSPNADTIILFIKPATTGEELPAGKLVEFLVGFTNNGDKDFILDTIDASFRYPMDFNFYIQNFSVISYERAVKPRQEATIMYSFYPAETFAGRPLGLSVNLAYHDADGNTFADAVFNQTVTITDLDDGLDGETFFLYLFMLAFAILLLVAGHHFLSSFSRKKGSKKTIMEVGTNSRNNVDYDWIPKETLNEIKKTPRQSPRQRKANREGSS